VSSGYVFDNARMADHPFQGLTLDLDDTLWPVQLTIVRAERVLQDWLAQHAPLCARQFDVDASRALRTRLLREHPEWRHDLSLLRLESLRMMLRESGEDPAQAEAAFEVFLAERQKVDLFDDTRPALARLASRFPIWALTNGNADVARVGLAEYFSGAVSARDAGAMKPDPRIFALACGSMRLQPHDVLHIGDDWGMDVVGARDAGLHAAWVDRHQRPMPDARAIQVSSLLDLCKLLGC
jgi:HAD superfamily hydrolase (TIGR01509 family)